MEELHEGLLNSLMNKYKEHKEKDKQRLIIKITSAINNSNYKYYCVRMVVTTGDYNYSDFYLYGSNVKQFTANDVGGTFSMHRWKSYMNAEKIAHYHSVYLLKTADVPIEIKRYMLTKGGF